MSERFAQFSVEGQQLYGMLHLPPGPGPHPAVVLLHGFTGNASETHFMFTRLARQLAADGLAALRFDCRGSGWSEGDFAQVTVASEVADARAALDYLVAQPEVDAERIGVLGFSLGGCVAALVAARDPRVQALVLWAAVADPQAMRERLLADAIPPLNDPAQPIDVGGLLVGPELLRELEQLRPTEELAAYRGPGLVIHGTADARVPVSEASAYTGALRPGYRQLLAVDGADHTFARMDHQRQIIGLSAAWLAAMLG